MIDFVVIAVVALVIGSAAAYIVKVKKSGRKCIGCPYSGSCSAQGKGCCAEHFQSCEGDSDADPI